MRWHRKVTAAEKELAAVPKDEAAAKAAWTKAKAENLARAKPLGGMPNHAQVFAGDQTALRPSRRPLTSRGATSWR